MISLGASNLVGQGASGLILTYSRTFRNGEYVRVADHEGTVTNLGAFTTRIRTGLGEELTISNSLVLGAVTKNYSRAVKGKGYVLDASVTIGYDTPWRQVTALLKRRRHARPACWTTRNRVSSRPRCRTSTPNTGWSARPFRPSRGRARK